MTKEQINARYMKEAIGVYPFISLHRITVLKKGLYTKKKEGYKGISYFFNDFINKYSSQLFGYYYIPEDIIVVPNTVELTQGKQDLIDSHVNQGFKVLYNTPKPKPIEFSEDSVEWKASKESYENYKETEDDTFNNEQSK